MFSLMGSPFVKKIIHLKPPRRINVAMLVGKRGGKAAAARNNAQMQAAQQQTFLTPLGQYHPADPSSMHFHGSPVNSLLHSSNVLDSSPMDEFYS